MEGPDSSYSCSLIHTFWKVDSEARTEPLLEKKWPWSSPCWAPAFDPFLHSIWDAWVHGGPTRWHCFGGEVLSDVSVIIHDGVPDGLLDITVLHTQKGELEEYLGKGIPLLAHGDHLTIRQLIALLQRRGEHCSGQLLLKVQGDLAELLGDVTHDFPLNCGGEAIIALCE